MVPGLAGGEWWRACRSSGSGREGSRNEGEGGVESGGKNELNSNSNLNRGKEMVLFGIVAARYWPRFVLLFVDPYQVVPEPRLLRMSGRDHRQHNRRFAARGNGYEARDLVLNKLTE
nr:hypothetical protein [Tanacetum cinerariifolium]